MTSWPRGAWPTLTSRHWGPFGRGWSLKRFSAQVVEPQCIPLIGYPKAWSPGTDGTLEAPVVYFDAKTEADFAKYKGKLKGAIVLTSPIREVAARWEPLANRKTDSELLALADAAEPDARGFGRRVAQAQAKAQASRSGRRIPCRFQRCQSGHQLRAGAAPAAGVPDDARAAGSDGAGSEEAAVLDRGRRSAPARTQRSRRRRHAVRGLGPRAEHHADHPVILHGSGPRRQAGLGLRQGCAQDRSSDRPRQGTLQSVGPHVRGKASISRWRSTWRSSSTTTT